MITAKTLQLLDANNVNISPAVCVESLYYEKNEGGETYRMSLRNRMVIAGSINTGVVNPENIEDRLFVPCYTINSMSSGDLVVYELNQGSYEITETVNSYINNTNSLINYTTTEELSQKYIKSCDGAIYTDNKYGACDFVIGSPYSNQSNKEYITMQTASGGSYFI